MAPVRCRIYVCHRGIDLRACMVIAKDSSASGSTTSGVFAFVGPKATPMKSRLRTTTRGKDNGQEASTCTSRRDPARGISATNEPEPVSARQGYRGACSSYQRDRSWTTGDQC